MNRIKNAHNPLATAPHIHLPTWNSLGSGTSKTKCDGVSPALRNPGAQIGTVSAYLCMSHFLIFFCCVISLLTFFLSPHWTQSLPLGLINLETRDLACLCCIQLRHGLAKEIAQPLAPSHWGTSRNAQAPNSHRPLWHPVILMPDVSPGSERKGLGASGAQSIKLLCIETHI